eukprot:SAG31_NODE_144_length_22617_cov_21.520117_19_plen_198_part_00
MNLGKGAELRLGGGRTRQLLGEFNGNVDVEDGELHLANVSGTGSIKVMGTAMLVLQGDSAAGAGKNVDIKLKLSPGARVDLVGKMNFSSAVQSEGIMNITAGATIAFKATEQSNISGLESFGNLHFEGGPVRLKQGAIKSYGAISVSSSLELESDEESVFGGGGVSIEPGAFISLHGRASLEGPMNNKVGELAMTVT